MKPRRFASTALAAAESYAEDWSKEGDGLVFLLELTDGAYCVRTSLDIPEAKLLGVYRGGKKQEAVA
jgi:hypothetical protein